MGNSRQFATVSQVELFKYQALGNDYLLVDLPAPLDELVARLPQICDRHFGLGSDGLLAFDPDGMSVRIFNPDRSEAQKSGNGLRIAAAHAVLVHGGSLVLRQTSTGNLVQTGPARRVYRATI